MTFVFARNNCILLLTLLLCLSAFNCSSNQNKESAGSTQPTSQTDAEIETEKKESNDAHAKAHKILRNEFLLGCSDDKEKLSYTLFGGERKILLEFENFDTSWEDESLKPEDSKNKITFLGKMIIQLHNPKSDDESGSEWRMIRSYNEQKNSWEEFKIPLNEESRKRYNLPAFFRVMKRNGEIKFEKNGSWVTFENFNFKKPNLSCSGIKSNSLSQQSEEILFGKKMTSPTPSANSNSSSNTAVTSTPYNINAMEEERQRLHKKEEEKDKKEVTELAKTFIETKAKCGGNYYWISMKNGLVYEFSSYQQSGEVNRIDYLNGRVLVQVNYVSYNTKTHLRGRTNSLPRYDFWMRYEKLGDDWSPSRATLSLPDCNTIQSQIQ